jgi:SAM-dependent methyltransferase
MPFADGAFDYVWTQHVAMNIQDRDGLYREIRRVLKPGGRFACHDIVLGTGEPIEFPLPWAATSAMSNVVSISDMNKSLEAAGFREVGWKDFTEEAQAFATAQRERQADGRQPQPANLVALIGDDFVPLMQNVARQIADGRLRAIMTIQHPV